MTFSPTILASDATGAPAPHSLGSGSSKTYGSIFFSVVIPAFNAERYVGETLKSVLRQSYPHFELLIVDDGSKDSTRRIVEDYAVSDPRVRLIALNKPSGGPSRPRNVGIAESRGDYIALLDSDDLWGPDKLLHDAEFLRQRPVDLLYSGAHYFQHSPEHVVHTARSRPPGPMLLVKNLVPTLTICLSKEFCREAPLFDEDPLLGIEDYHLVLRAYLSGRSICNRPGVDAYYRREASGSYYRRDNFGLLLRQHLYNITRIALTHRISLPKLYALWLVLTVFFVAKKLLGRQM